MRKGRGLGGPARQENLKKGLTVERGYDIFLLVRNN